MQCQCFCFYLLVSVFVLFVAGVGLPFRQFFYYAEQTKYKIKINSLLFDLFLRNTSTATTHCLLIVGVCQ